MGTCRRWRLLGLEFGTVEGTHALIILLDQFPRNMFRGSAKSFWSDALARETAGRAIAKGQDMKLPEVGRHFIYLPFMHSECLEEQERSVSLYCSRFPDTDAENLVHARAHREIIRIFGRFPYRNEALKRKTTETEAKWMAEGGYRQMVETMRSSQ